MFRINYTSELFSNWVEMIDFSCHNPTNTKYLRYKCRLRTRYPQNNNDWNLVIELDLCYHSKEKLVMVIIYSGA